MPNTDSTSAAPPNQPRRQEAIVGAFLGMAAGAALAAPADGLTTLEIRRQWGTLRDVTAPPGEPLRAALAALEGILHEPADPLWAIRRRLQGRQSPASALASVVPVALACPDRQRTLALAAAVAALAGASPEAAACAAALCLWLRASLAGLPPRAGWEEALTAAQDAALLGDLHPDTRRPTRLPDAFWERLAAAPSRRPVELSAGRADYGSQPVECLEAAACCLAGAGSLEEAVVAAANVGGHASSMAAIAGAIAGACWGPDALPERWRAAVPQWEQVARRARIIANLERQWPLSIGYGLRAFEYHRVAERLFVGRAPLTAPDVELLAGEGIVHVIDLREPAEWQPPLLGREAIAEMALRGIVRHPIPLRDLTAPTPADFDAAWRIAEAAPAGLYVHCRAGIERSATIAVAITARRERIPYEAALARLQAERPALRPMYHQEAAARAWLRQ